MTNSTPENSTPAIVKGDIVKIGTTGTATWKVFQIDSRGNAWLLRAVRDYSDVSVVRYTTKNATARGIQATKTVHVDRLRKIA